MTPNKKAYVVRGAKMRCKLGSHTRKINLPICHGAYVNGKPVMNEEDNKVEDNVPYFGICSSPENKCTEIIDLKSEEDGSRITGKKCTPEFLAEWINTKEDALVDGKKALTTDSKLICTYMGEIGFISDGQEVEKKEGEQVEEEKISIDGEKQTGKLEESIKAKILRGDGIGSGYPFFTMDKEEIKAKVADGFMETAKAIPLPPSNHNNVKKAQYYLEVMGFDIGGIDGIMGVKSSSALVILQSYIDRENVTGEVNVLTIEKLKSLAESGVTYSSIKTTYIDNWSPRSATISKVREKNGHLEKENMVRIPTKGGGNAYAEKESVISWAMMVNEAMEYNKTTQAKLKISNFGLKGPNSGYRAYNQQVEAYIDDEYLGGALAANVSRYWKKPEAAKEWLNENAKNFGKNGHWNNVPDNVTAEGGPLAGYGASKHGWGLALDMCVGNKQNSFADSLECEWLEKNAAKYGFEGLVKNTNKKGKTRYLETWHWNYTK
ncbi:PAAR-like protein [Wukongibacter baidiensis]|uniref:PAAR-like protein n=1 Tax=Wukongibacter baidiensis TaxID=1723361 RepID=UPI003D7FF819